MRIGIALPDEDVVGWAQRADRAGLAFVAVTGSPGAECVQAARIAVRTEDVRIVVGIELGHDNPVTLVEEINVLDHLAGGRVIALFRGSAVEPSRLREELELCRIAGTQTAFSYDGEHWRLPARLPEHTAPETMMVTPPPSQLTVPLWADEGLPDVDGVVRVATTPADVVPGAVAPARLALTGDLDQDLAAAASLRDAGATHCLADLPGSDPERAFDQLVRWVAPDSSMVGFPRIVADADLPAPWPGPAVNQGGTDE